MMSLLSRLPRWLLILAAILALGIVALFALGLTRAAAGMLGALGLMLFGGAKSTAPTNVRAQVEALNEERKAEVAARSAEKPGPAVAAGEFWKRYGGKKQ